MKGWGLAAGEGSPGRGNPAKVASASRQLNSPPGRREEMVDH